MLLMDIGKLIVTGVGGLLIGGQGVSAGSGMPASIGLAW